MTGLQTLGANSGVETILEALRRDGAAIVADLPALDALAKLNAELRPFAAGTPMSGDDFGGRRTQRTGMLVARCPRTNELTAEALAQRVASPLATEESGCRRNIGEQAAPRDAQASE